MTTLVTQVPRRDVPEDLFSDITTSAILGMSWADSALTVEFADDLTVNQVIDVRLRMGSRDDTEAFLFADMLQARLDNQTYLDLPSPDAGDVLAHMQRICLQNNSIANLLLGQLADITPP